MKPLRILTLGHGTLSAEEFTALVRGAGIGRVVDVRSFPGSRHNPQFKREAMADWLAEAGVEYRWEERLGGRRRGVGDRSVHTGLRHASFRAYADWMETAEFAAGLADVLTAAQGPALARSAGTEGDTNAGVSSRDGQEGPANTAARPAAESPGLTALMCSESVWWRCHRRLITDHLVLIEQVEVRHLMHDGRLQHPHVTPEARAEGDVVIYDGGQGRLDLDPHP